MSIQKIEIIPVTGLPEFKSNDDLVEILSTTLNNPLTENDILVITQKIISKIENRSVNLQDKDFSEILKDEATQIIRKRGETIIARTKHGFICANAGIDKSNTGGSKLILYPNKPYLVAEQIKRKFFLILSIHVGVIIVDSRLMPSRVGTIGITIGCAGIEPLTDMRGQKDLDGNSLKVTFQATSDTLASIANHKMGEGSESQPFAIVRDSESKLTNRQIQHGEMTISHEQCVYIRGFEKR